MAFRFRKALSVLPGVKVNVTKRGLSSVSMGRKGAMINLGKSGRVKQTVGLPGSGLSYQTDKSTPKWLFIVVLAVIFAIWYLSK